MSLALTGGLADVSHALLLDRPRSLVQDAMAESDADDIDVAIVIPPTRATPRSDATPTTTTQAGRREAAARQKFTPRRSSGSGSQATRW